jgi:ribonucleoside-diphosphate reductase alpha chain
METEMAYTYDDALAASIEYFNGNELAARVFLDKYALKDNDLNILEKTPEEMHRRIAREFARIEAKKFKNPLSEEEIFSYIDRFGKIIPQGSPMFGIGNIYQTISISNCFVVPSAEDSYGGICKTDEELAQISKRRGGVGVDTENIRPIHARTQNAARTSTGLIPFMSRFSNTIREVGQNGRRGALMLSTSIHHPESVIPWDDDVDGVPFDVKISDKDLGQFIISSKWFNPNKLDFATCKYDKTKVTGANISIRVTDEFLNAVDNNEDYEQRWPVNSKTPKISKKVSAKKVWDKIIYSAWRTAEPGILFWDNIIRESVADCYAKYGFTTISTNPCGEIPLCAYDSCRLLVLNLFQFVVNPFKKNAYFDYAEFYRVAKIAQRLMDDLVDLEEECIIRIIDKVKNDPEDNDIKARELYLWNKVLEVCRNGRRTGTGITAIGDALAAINIGYGSDKGIAATERIYKTLKFAAYESSIDMAEELGAFPVWDHELEKDNPFLKRFIGDTCDLHSHPNDGNTFSFVDGTDLYNRMVKVGRRNIALLTTAPTGTVSIVARLINYFGTSSGIEPQFSITPYIRRKKGNPGDSNFRSDFVDQNGDHWQEFKIYPSAVTEWIEATGIDNITKSPWYGHCAPELEWTQRVKLQAAAQKHVDHSISSTLNLPNNVTVERVDEIYRTAWKSGCKGVTIYRDGCRTGVLVNETDSKKAARDTNDAPKRPQTIESDVYHTAVKGKEYFVIIGMFEGMPYEVFAGENGMIAKKVKKAKVTKMKRGHYQAEFDDGNVMENIADHISEDQEGLARLTSLALRHGNDINYIVHQLEKVKGDMSSFAKAMARKLKLYISDGTEVKGESCIECGGNLARQEGCMKCVACGWTKCN